MIIHVVEFRSNPLPGLRIQSRGEELLFAVLLFQPETIDNVISNENLHLEKVPPFTSAPPGRTMKGGTFSPSINLRSTASRGILTI